MSLVEAERCGCKFWIPDLRAIRQESQKLRYPSGYTGLPTYRFDAWMAYTEALIAALRDLLASEDLHQGTEAATCPSCRAYNAARTLVASGIPENREP